MTTITVTHNKQPVATITRDKATPAEPWALQRHTGRIDRFHNLNAAKYEANKTWPGCKFLK
jgi:hypothetical protein